MCKFRTLSYNPESGFVIQCTHCNYVRIGYANLQLQFQPEGFRLFVEKIRDLKLEFEKTDTDPTTRFINAPLPYQGIQLILSKNELAALDHLLETADAEMLSLELLGLFADQQAPE